MIRGAVVLRFLGWFRAEPLVVPLRYPLKIAAHRFPPRGGVGGCNTRVSQRVSRRGLAPGDDDHTFVAKRRDLFNRGVDGDVWLLT